MEGKEKEVMEREGMERQAKGRNSNVNRWKSGKKTKDKNVNEMGKERNLKNTEGLYGRRGQQKTRKGKNGKRERKKW